MSRTKQIEVAKTPEALRVAAGYATQVEVAALRVVSETTLRKVEAGEPGVNTGTLDDLAVLYGIEREVMYAAYALVRRRREEAA